MGRDRAVDDRLQPADALGERRGLGQAVVVALAACVLAVAFHAFVDHVVAVEHEQPLRAVEKLIRDMRAAGTDEEGIYSGTLGELLALAQPTPEEAARDEAEDDWGKKR